MRPHCSLCASGQDVLHLQEHGFLAGHDRQEQAFHRLETPPELAEAYRRMLVIAKPKRAPRLLCRDVVGGSAGRWFSLGVIVLGLNEIDALADKLWWKLRLDQRWARRLPHRDHLRHVARVFILAHELGHELNHEGRSSPHDMHAEAAADYWAGQITARLTGIDGELGATFFALIGCNEKFCTHPSSDGRSQAFRDGFRSGFDVAEQDSDRQTTSDKDRATPPPKDTGPGVGEVIAGAAATAAVVYGAVKIIEALFGGGKTYHADVDRYRNRRGQFTRG